MNILKLEKNKLLIPDFMCNESLRLLKLNRAEIIFYKFDSLDNVSYINKLTNQNVAIFLFVNYFGESKYK